MLEELSGQWCLPWETATLYCWPGLPSSTGTGVSMVLLSSTQTVAMLSQGGICPCVASRAPSLLAKLQLRKGGWSPLLFCLTGDLLLRWNRSGSLQGLAFLPCLSLWSGDPLAGLLGCRVDPRLSLSCGMSRQNPDQQISKENCMPKSRHQSCSRAQESQCEGPRKAWLPQPGCSRASDLA